MKESYLYTVDIRFYDGLNDFLPLEHRKKSFKYKFFGKPTVKDLIESLGVPHTEVDYILLNGEPVDFNAHVRDGDQLSVYPLFKSIEIEHLSPKPPLMIRFITDVHLGKLARYLRMLGFDTLYDSELDDEMIIALGVEQERIILTRDLGILKNGRVLHGYFIRSSNPKLQLREIVRRYGLKDKIKPFSLCMECNESLQVVEKELIATKLLPETAAVFNEFFQCPKCQKIYWEGSHHEKMSQFIRFICS